MGKEGEEEKRGNEEEWEEKRKGRKGEGERIFSSGPILMKS